jgi:hypothetical protein
VTARRVLAALLLALRQRPLLTGLELALALGTLLLALAGFMRALPYLLNFSAEQPVDFGAYYFGASVLNMGQPLYIDEYMALAARQTAGTGSYSPYLYPPFLAAVLRPLAALPYDTAKLIWLIGNLALLFLSIFLLARAIGMPHWALALVLPCSLLMPAVYDTLLLGQINIVLLALLTGALVLSVPHPAAARRESIAGALLAVAAAIKVFPGGVALVYLTRGRVATLVWLVLALCGAFLVGMVAGGGWDSTLYWLLYVLPDIPVAEPVPAIQSLHAVMARLFSMHEFDYSVMGRGNTVTHIFYPLVDAPATGQLLASLGSAIMVSITVLWLVLRARQRRGDSLQDFALTLTAILVSIPFLWDYYYVLLFIPLFVLGRECYQAPLASRHTVCLFLLLSLLLLVLHRYWRWMSQFVQTPLLLSLGFAGALVLWLGLLYVTHPWGASSTQVTSQTLPRGAVIRG